MHSLIQNIGRTSFSAESDILEKVGKFNISKGTISRVIQPSLVQ